MAKKKGAPKKGSLRGGARAQVHDPVIRTKGGTPKRSARKSPPRQPKQKSFDAPGFEKIRDPEMDAVCESIGDARDRQAKALADEKADKLIGIDIMARKGYVIYSHAKVELVYVPGDPKLRVRVLKDPVAGGATKQGQAPGVAPPPPVHDDDGGEVDQQTGEVTH